MHNRAPLPKDAYKIRSDIPPVQSKLDISLARQVILSSDKTYRAVFASIFQAGMDQERFIEWNRTGYINLIEALGRADYPINIGFSGRKQYRNVKPYFSFLGDDAIDAIKTYLRDVRARITLKIDGYIFYTRNGYPITKNSMLLYWLRRLDKCGVIDRTQNDQGRAKRYGVNIHELRDLFRSQWEKSPAKASVAEHCMGHVGDPLGYEKASSDPEWAKAEYMKAIPWLNILSNPINETLESEIGKLNEQNVRLYAEIEKIKTMLGINEELVTNPDLSEVDDLPWNRKKRDQ